MHNMTSKKSDKTIKNGGKHYNTLGLFQLDPKQLSSFFITSIITQSHKSLKSGKGHPYVMWGYGFGTILNIWKHWFFWGVKYPIIFKFVLIHICDVELVGQKYHWALWLKT